jgi:hypothetical protein
MKKSIIDMILIFGGLSIVLGTVFAYIIAYVFLGIDILIHCETVSMIGLLIIVIGFAVTILIPDTKELKE